MADSFADLMPSRFYKTEDVADAPIQLTIKSVGKPGSGGKETLEFKGKAPELVTIIRFEGSDREVIAKNDVLLFLKEAFGTPSACAGKSVELYKDPSVMFGGKKVGGLRLRAPSADQGPAF